MWSAAFSTGSQETEILEQAPINSPWYALLVWNAKMKIRRHMLSSALVEEAIQLSQDWSQKFEEKQIQPVS